MSHMARAGFVEELLVHSPFTSRACSQVAVLVMWFQSWTAEERRQFFNALLEHAIPTEADEFSLLFSSSMAVHATEKLSWDPAQARTLADQVRIFLAWFTTWSDGEKNVMMSALEEIDLLLVYEFIDRFKLLRWR